ncbi:SymE family type I addiction module toxin [Paraburkholderia youngii]
MWLEHAGFEPGQRVRIEVHHGRLVITPDGTTP